MKAMQPASARALIVTAVLIVLAGLLVPSPSGAFLAFCLAALIVAYPAIFGPGKSRIIAAVLLLSSALLAAGKYPDFRSEQNHYRQRTKTARSTSTHVADNGGRARLSPWGIAPAKSC